MTSPCNKCEERHEGCHSKCMKYLCFKTKMKCVAAKRRKDMLSEAAACERSIRIEKKKKRSAKR